MNYREYLERVSGKTIVVIDFYPEKTYKFPPCITVYDPQVIHGPYGDYYRLKTGKSQAIIPWLKRNHIKYRMYEEKWSRSDDYREEFLKKTNFPVRCRYCRTWIYTPKYMQVDHIVAINQVKKSDLARFILWIRGAKGVNDAKNLAPSCPRCNRKKADKGGIWILKGFFGDILLFWILYYGVILALLGALIYGYREQLWFLATYLTAKLGAPIV